MNAGLMRFKGERDENARKSLLMLFFYAQTKEGDSAVDAASHDPSLSEGVRHDAQEWLKNAKGALGQKTEIQGDETTVRENRRKRLGAVSDESSDDVQEMTMRLIQLRHK